MSKKISQETYNQVVQENMDEFSMTQKEAIEDAIKQFEAQVKTYLKISISHSSYIYHNNMLIILTFCYYKKFKIVLIYSFLGS